MMKTLVGDMSFVGPRRLLMRFLPRCHAFQAQCMLVNSGVNVWSQVYDHYALSENDEFARNAWHVQNQSLWLDLKLIVKTFFVDSCRRTANSTSVATMGEIMGD